MGSRPDELHAILTPERLIELQTLTHHVRVDDAINDYILDIVAATRKHSELTLGVSTRGADHVPRRRSRGWRLVEGRDYVIPDDVKRTWRSRCWPTASSAAA